MELSTDTTDGTRSEQDRTEQLLDTLSRLRSEGTLSDEQFRSMSLDLTR